MLFGSSNQPDVCVELSSSGTLLQCSESLDAHPYLVAEEETYEPPADPDSGKTKSSLLSPLVRAHSHAYVLCRVSGLSLEELGLRALEQIPRDRAIDGIQAFMDLRFASLDPTQLPALVYQPGFLTEMV